MDEFLEKTDHELVEYDPLTETYFVDLSPGTWCEVFGPRKYEMAFKIAEKCFEMPNIGGKRNESM